ncbi:MAG: hypothetical protein ACYTAF_01905 [Planctomycetota bacterium]|jgi:hypothetical protein
MRPRGRTPSRRYGAGPGRERAGERGTGRGYAPARKKNNTPVIIGACAGGAVLLILIIAIAAGSGGGKKKRRRPRRSAEPAAVDVSSLERDGRRLCDQGLGVIQSCEADMHRSLPLEEQRALKKKLLEGRRLIREGLGKFERAMDLSGKRYDVKRYQKAQKAVAGKILELPD